MPTIEQRLSQWQQDLLDLTNRNRLLSFHPSTSRPSSLQLVAPPVADLYQALLQGKSLLIVGKGDVDDTENAEASAEDLALGSAGTVSDRQPAATIEADSRIVLPASTVPPPIIRPGTTLSSLPPERANRVALRLLTRARASEQEQGINILFAVFGRLKWQEKPEEQTWRYAPVVMLPVKIEENAREGSFRISAAGDDPEFNQTLAERIRRDFGVDLAVEMDEETPLLDVFDKVRAAVAKRSGWEVLEEAHVGLFQFHKLRMFKDLTEHADVAAQHEIVQALALEGVTIAPMPEGIPSEDELDRVVDLQHSFTVLDADASQMRAIQAAIRGANLIIQGPPGTGKSQTIANIIAECIAAGKTALFVSEKAAAIEVVHRRLAERGLGEFCLMLHSQKASKREVIYDLGSRLEPEPPPASSPQEELDLKRLQQTRARLNAYAEALHRTREPLRQSAFWVHGELASLNDVPYLSVTPPSVDNLTLEQLDDWKMLIDQAARYAPVLSEGPSHPWAGIRRHDLTLADQASLRQTLTSLRDNLGVVRTEGQIVADQLGLPVPVTMSDARNLVRIADTIPSDRRLRAAWFDRDRIQQTETLAAEAAKRATAARELADRLFATYHDQILGAARPEVVASYERGYLARLVSLTHRRFRAEVRSAATNERQRSVGEELSDLRDARQVNEHLAWFRQREGSLSETLGLTLTGASVPDAGGWTRTARDVAATAAILAVLPPGPPPAAFVERVCQAEIRSGVAASLRRLDVAISQVEVGIATLQAFFAAETLRVGDVSLADANLDLVRQGVEHRLTRFDDLDPWLRTQAILAQARRAGLGTIVEQLIDQKVSPERWSDVFRRLVLTHWLVRVYGEDEALRSFRGYDHETTIARFRYLDKSYIDTSVRRIRRVLAERQTRISTAHGGEPGLVRFEARKRKRHMPLRRLFERIPNLLPTLKPCLMMSPLSVAQFLPADRYQFDVVIFDEASQVRPHDAIGAIMRGKQLVTAGDDKQLPPTTFFDRTVDDGTIDEGEDVRALDSILDVLNAKNMQSQPLLWHYRSRHEDLIAYSNHHFYDRRLITFPSPAAGRSPRRGVRLEYVPNARYEDERDRVLGTPVRVNRIEARRVAELVLHHARTRSDEPLGVVTLGMNQRDVVEEEIKRARLLDQSLDDFFRPDKSDPFFVKALEQVQGDERDVIMISIGYGKNAQGVLSRNFGPINQEGGERRLNVLVTRARHQVIVVSSIRAGDIVLSETQKRGPQLLKNYLDFAERGQDALEAEWTGGDGDYESPFEEEVGEALKRAGYDVGRQVGCSKFRIDLAVVDPRQPGRYILGIECDGRTYHASKTARDRDRLRQEVLEKLGWKIHRIWSTDWIRQPGRELDRVIDRVDQLLDGREPDADESASGSPAVGLVDEADTVAADQQVSPSAQVLPAREAVEILEVPKSSATIAIPYRLAELRVVGYGDILSTPLPRIADAVATCVEVEGPIHRDLLARRIVQAWGFQRAGARIAARVEEGIAAAAHQGRIKRSGAFLWPPGHVEIVPRGPAPDGAVREMAHIVDQEIVRGMTLLLGHAFSLTEEELVIRTARLFGNQRTGSDINRRLRAMVQRALKDGSIVARGERYQLPR